MTLTLYTNPMSRGRIARWMMEEAGQPYETVYLDYATTMKQLPYIDINPMGKVPALVHDGRVVTEYAAICAYMAMRFLMRVWRRRTAVPITVGCFTGPGRWNP